MLDPRLLQSLVVLAEELHFGRAAKRLNVAQPGLSQQIQRLERQVGCPVCRRDSRGVTMTDAGQAMLEPARAAVRAFALAERSVRSTPAPVQEIRVGLDFTASDAVPALVAYEADHEDMMLCVSRMQERRGHEALAAGHLDVFVGLLPPAESDPPSRVRLGAADVVLWALLRRDHPLAGGAAVRLELFRQWPILMDAREQSPARFDLLVEILSQGEGQAALSLRERRRTGIDARSEAMAAIRHGPEVGVGSPSCDGPLDAELCHLPFDPPLRLSAYVSWHAGRSAAADALVEQLQTTQTIERDHLPPPPSFRILGCVPQM